MVQAGLTVPFSMASRTSLGGRAGAPETRTTAVVARVEIRVVSFIFREFFESFWLFYLSQGIGC